MTDLRTYLAEKLAADGYDGLCWQGGVTDLLWHNCCACPLDDLFPCGNCPSDCCPAYRIPCTKDKPGCEQCWANDDENEWCYTIKKPEGR